MNAKEITHINTKVNLNTLLESNNALTDIKLTGPALQTLKTVTKLVEQHHQTLQTIILDGAFTDSKETHLAKIALLLAIMKCQQLTTLALENFSMFFVNSFQRALDELISTLPKLNELSLKNTCISGALSKLSAGIAKTTSLQVLDLTATDCVAGLIGRGININRSLRVLYLGNCPIMLYLDVLFDAIIQIGNNIQYINWEPPTFEQHETELLQIFSKHGDVDVDIVELRTMYQDDEFGLVKRKANYQLLCAKLARLKLFLSHRREPLRLTQLKITLENNFSYRLDLPCSKLAQQKESLTCLILEFPTIDTNRIFIKTRDRKFVLEALNVCERLEEINFINMQCFFGDVIIKIIETLTRLPHLQRLTLTHTYLGERGAEALGVLLRKNILEELKISHVGFTNENCFMILMRALKDNTSLKKLHLGSSPMTLSWIRVMANFVFYSTNTSLKKIEWSATTLKAMEESMLRLCRDENQCLYINNNFDYQLEQFLAQPTEYLVSQWMLFQDLLTMKLNPVHSAEKQKKMMRQLLDNILGKVIEPQVNENTEESQPLNLLPNRSYNL